MQSQRRRERERERDKQGRQQQTGNARINGDDGEEADVRYSPVRGTHDDSSSRGSRPGGKTSDCIGFATLPEQIHRKSVKRGFDFTLMVVGEAGLGKSTMINSLFLTDLYKGRQVPVVEERIEKTVKIEKKMLEIEEQGVKLRLTIVDTPGFGDAVNNNSCWQPVADYIESQFEQFFKDESGLNRRNIQDNRVHCCLYFISPIGHGLRPIDVEFMRHLHDKVNIIPVISKADTLTPQEIQTLKARVLDQIGGSDIRIYEFPATDEDEDDEVKAMDRELRDSMPFAVIGSNQIFEVNGKRVRGRQYPWGIVEVENPKHSDFIKLRTMLMVTHMHDLKDVTRDMHYESYRAQYITKTMRDASRGDKTSTATLAQAVVNQAVALDTAANPRGAGGARVSTRTSKEKILKQKDAEIARMQEMILQMQKQLTAPSAAPANTSPSSSNASTPTGAETAINV